MALPFGKFFWSDYASDPALKVCSFAAQGLWMRMLCIAAEHTPVGYVAVNGRGLDAGAVARATGGGLEEVEKLLAELKDNGVYSTDRRGVIYSRRMIRDAKKAQNARLNGKKGGNPRLGIQRDNLSSDNRQDNLPLNGADKPHIPDTRNQSSVDKSTADSDQVFWANAKAFLATETRGDPGKLVGAWCRDHGKEATAAAITKAQLERPAQRIPFIVGCLKQTRQEADDWSVMP